MYNKCHIMYKDSYSLDDDLFPERLPVKCNDEE